MVGISRGKGDFSIKPGGYLLLLHENRIFKYMTTFHVSSEH